MFQRTQLSRHAHQTRIRTLDPNLLSHIDLLPPAPVENLAHLIVRGGFMSATGEAEEAVSEAEAGEGGGEVRGGGGTAGGGAGGVGVAGGC